MGCNCGGGGGSAGEPGDNVSALRAAFQTFWPSGSTFPPGAPWIAAAVSRPEAYDLVQRFAGDFPGLHQGSFVAFAELVSAVLYSDGAEYAKTRKKKKTGGGTAPSTYQRCFEAACADCGGCANVFGLSYDPNTGWCRYTCGGTTTGSGLDIPETETSSGGL